eukprot:363901-Chlamydomonas_euryale.AAC.6
MPAALVSGAELDNGRAQAYWKPTSRLSGCSDASVAWDFLLDKGMADVHARQSRAHVHLLFIHAIAAHVHLNGSLMLLSYEASNSRYPSP